MSLTYIPFRIDNSPFAVWGDDLDLRDESIEFVNNIDSQLFRFQLELHLEELRKDPKNVSAAIAIRLTYYHALETFLSLLAAAIQAPYYSIGWVMQYTNFQLRSVIKKIDEGSYLYNKHNLKILTWESAVNLIHRIELLNEHDQAMINKLIIFWRKCGLNHISERSILEYNSLKHGFRVKFGGSHLNIGGIDLRPGDYGLTYRFPVPFDKKRKFNFYTELGSTHWNPFRNATEILLLSCSINNIKGFLTPYCKSGQVDFSYEIPKKEWFDELNELPDPDLLSIKLKTFKYEIDPSKLPQQKDLNKLLEEE